MEDIDIVAELEAAVAGESDTSKPAIEQGLVWDSDQANQWIEQIAQVRAKRRDYEAAYNAAVKRMADRLALFTDKMDEQEEWLEEALQVWHEITLANDETAKSVVLPAGVLKSGTWGGDIWDYDDETFDAWAMENLPGAVEYPAPKVVRATAKQLIKDSTVRVSDGVVVLSDGEETFPVEGLTISPRPRAYKVVDNATAAIEKAAAEAKKAAKGEAS